MRWRRWALALVIALMVVDAWMPGAVASGPRRGIALGVGGTATRK